MTRSHGRETWYRLREWDAGQAAAERLSSLILSSEGYEDIDPSHPLGGRDGKKDMKCVKKGIKYIGASYFPRGQMPFKEIKKKFLADLEGVNKNNVEGFVFITNQELTLSEREQLENTPSHPVDIFHLERITNILNQPSNYGTRATFLEMDVSREELLSLYALNEARQTEKNKILEQKIDLLTNAYQELSKGKRMKSKNHPRNAVRGDVYLVNFGPGIGGVDEILRAIPAIIVSDDAVDNKSNPSSNKVAIIIVQVQPLKENSKPYVELGYSLTPLISSVALLDSIFTINRKRLGTYITSLDESLMNKIKEGILRQYKI
ncbi:type II toxin-antitoxin system PemK/MazF family toxin [Priestia aryabhattai]|uniref:type II toxin-antitoxin system PemK/MazF family toxin n=1 Tax=Priestia aryabhattai TaxID=412384 RepID=UPI003D296D62